MAETLSAQKTVKFIVTRQESPDSKPYTEEFEIPYRSNMNVISGLMEVQRNPKNAKGDKDDTCMLGIQLSRRSMRSLFHGYQR